MPGKENYIEMVLVGVVTVISPWNVPLHLSLRAVAPAIALGNTVILKPSFDTPIAGGLLLARLFELAGLPLEVLSVPPGRVSVIGDYITSHPRSRVVAFTGSTEVEGHVASLAVRSFAHPSHGTGGNNPYTALDDADVEQAINAWIYGSFLHQGQICRGINKTLVRETIYDEYARRFTQRVKDHPAGDLHDEKTIVGPIIDQDQMDRILGFIRDTVKLGAKTETGG